VSHGVTASWWQLLGVGSSVCLAALMLSFPAQVSAADFNVNAHTSGQFFEYVRVDGDVVPRRRATQYLGVNGYDLLGDGKNTLSFQTSFRFDTDLGLIDEEFEDADIPDVHLTEWIAWVPLLILIVVLGVYPHLLFQVTDPSMTAVGQVFTALGG